MPKICQSLGQKHEIIKNFLEHSDWIFKSAVEKKGNKTSLND